MESPFDPYVPSSTPLQSSLVPLQLVLIRLDTRYSAVAGKNHGASRTAGTLLVNGHLMSDTIEDYDYGWDENTTEAEIHLIKGNGTASNRGSIDPRTKQSYKGRTAIPSGQYHIKLQSGGKFGRDAIMVSKDFGIDKVPGFTGIRIHAGRNSGYTEGCILVGANSKIDKNRFADYQNLPFDRNKLGGGGNARWTPGWLQELIRHHGGIATLTIRRSYPSQALCNRQEEIKDKQKCLGRLQSHRDRTVILNHFGLLSSTPDTSQGTGVSRANLFDESLSVLSAITKAYKTYPPATTGKNI